MTRALSLYAPAQVMAKRTSRAFGQSPALGLVPEDLPGGLSEAQRLKMLETTGRCDGFVCIRMHSLSRSFARSLVRSLAYTHTHTHTTTTNPTNNNNIHRGHGGGNMCTAAAVMRRLGRGAQPHNTNVLARRNPLRCGDNLTKKKI
jgi:hypothetical protein